MGRMGRMGYRARVLQESSGEQEYHEDDREARRAEEMGGDQDAAALLCAQVPKHTRADEAASGNSAGRGKAD